MLQALQNKLGSSADDLSHHAYLLSGTTEELHGGLKELLHTVWNIPHTPPTVFEYIYDSLGIDEGRQLQTLASRKGFGDTQFFIVRTKHITHQAQSALLKLFEEPSASVFFFVIVPNSDMLLPTLRSRFQYVPTTTTPTTTKEAERFLASPITDRLTQIEPLLKEKDRDAATHFVASLGRVLRAKKVREMQTHILTAEHCLASPSPSLKQVLEGLAYSLPHLHTREK